MRHIPSLLKYVLPFVAVVSCAPEQIVDDCGGQVVVQRQGAFSVATCGGCDTRCWLSTDHPDNITDVVLGGAGQNGDHTVYEDSIPIPGVILSGLVFGADDDLDGLPNHMDPNPADMNGDVDGDGVPDSYEYFLGSDPEVDDNTVPANHLYMVLPHGEGPISHLIPDSVDLELSRADVYFLIDTTMSMDDELGNLKSSITSTLMDGIDDILWDAQFGVGHYRDYASSGGPYQNLQTITDDPDEIDDALDGLGNSSGNPDWAEAGTAALHAVATGEPLGCGPGTASCPPGHYGHPCFRPGSQPIIIMMTDAAFHNGVWDDLDPPAGGATMNDCYEMGDGGCDDWTCFPPDPPCPSLQTVVGELVAIGAKVIGVWSGDWPGLTGRVSDWAPPTWGRTYPDLDEMLDLYYTVLETGSVDLTNAPFIYGISNNGAGMDAQIVTAVEDLVADMLLEVRSSWYSVPAGGAALVVDVEPVNCNLCDHCDSGTNTCYDVYPGSGIEFQMTFQNDAITPTAGPQEFEIHIEIIGNDVSVLTERIIHIMVPGTDWLAPPPTEGSYWHVFEKADTCTNLEQVNWERLIVDIDTPAGTSITFSAQTAANSGDLPSATVVPLPLGPANQADIQEALNAEGISTTLPYLQITATLQSTTPGITPVLREMTVRNYCL